MKRKTTRTEDRTELRTLSPLNPREWARTARELRLSPRQAQIVELILHAKRDKQIAAALSMTLPTLRTHLGRVFERLGVTDRVELVLHVFATFRRLCRRDRT